MNFFCRNMADEFSPSQNDIIRCPFLRNINEPTNFSFSSSMAFPMPAQGTKGPIFEDGPNFDMAFRLFHGQNGVVPLSEGSLQFPQKVSHQQKKHKSSKKDYSQSGELNHEATGEEWLKSRNCPIAKSCRAVSNVLPLVAKAFEPPSGIKYKCPPAIVAARAAIARSAFAKKLRPQPLPAEALSIENGVVPLCEGSSQFPQKVSHQFDPLAATISLSGFGGSFGFDALSEMFKKKQKSSKEGSSQKHGVKFPARKNIVLEPVLSETMANVVVAAGVNIPLGIWREHMEEFSPSWYAAVHAAVPFIPKMCESVSMPKTSMAITLAACVAGQLIGSRAERYHLKAIANANANAIPPPPLKEASVSVAAGSGCDAIGTMTELDVHLAVSVWSFLFKFDASSKKTPQDLSHM